MPLSEKEVTLINEAKNRGLNRDQALQALNQYRSSLGMNGVDQASNDNQSFESKLLSAEPTLKRGTSWERGTGASGVIQGIGQGFGRLLSGAAELGTEAGKRVGKLIGTYDGEVGQGPTISSDLDQLLTPVTTAQKIGFGAEKIAEFVAPSAMVGKLVGTAAKARNLAPIATKALQAVTQGVTGATVASVQEGEVGKEAVQAGIISGAMPIVAPVIGKLVSKAAQRIAPKLEASAARLLQSSVKQGAKGMKEAQRNFTSLGEKMLGLVKKGQLDPSDTVVMQKQAQTWHKTINDEIGKTLQNIDDTLVANKNMLPSASGAGKVSKQQVIKDGLSKFKEAVGDIVTVDEQTAMKEVTKQMSQKGLTAQKINNLKIKFRNLAKGTADDQKSRIYGKASDMFRNMIENLDDTGKIKELNESWKLWTDIEEASINKNIGLQKASEEAIGFGEIAQTADITRPLSLVKGAGKLINRLLPKSLRGAKGKLNLAEKLRKIQPKEGVSNKSRVLSKLLSGVNEPNQD